MKYGCQIILKSILQFRAGPKQTETRQFQAGGLITSKSLYRIFNEFARDFSQSSGMRTT